MVNGSSEWGDSLVPVWFDNKLHCAGQARRAIYPENTHLVFDLEGNLLYNIAAPFNARAEGPTVVLNNKLYVFGGTTTQDTWCFDPTIDGYTANSWYLVGNYQSAIGGRKAAWGIVLNGWFYCGGGIGSTTVYKTQNFTTWTLVGNLPTNIAYITTMAWFEFQGKLWVIGGSAGITSESVSIYDGAVDGYVYSFDPVTEIWTLVHQDKELFGSMFIDGGANSTAMYVSKGYISAQQLATFPPGSNARQGNNRGLLRSTDGINWTEVTLTDGLAFFYESHRRGLVTVGEDIYSLAGFAANDMWKISE